MNGWLRQVARQHQDKGLSKAFVARSLSDLQPAGERLVGLFLVRRKE